MPLLKPKTYYLNALFDLQLGDYSCNSVLRSAAEMATLFLPCCTKKDRLIVDVDLPDSYFEYLDSSGITMPGSIDKFTQFNQFDSEGVAWGWTDVAVSRLQSSGVTCNFPDLEVVKKINNRRFCNEIGIIYNLGVPGSQFCSSIDNFYRSTETLKEQYPLVIKPAFGGSGFGLHIIQSPDEISRCVTWVENFCCHGGFIIEPWCDRLCDLSTNLYIHENGTVDTIRYQRLFSNEYGSFFGIYIAPQDPILDVWKGMLEETALIAATQIRNAGYFGPVGFDSFVYRSKDNKEMLAPVIEINGRHVMSHVAYAVRNQVALGQYCFFRMVSKKRCKLPDNYAKMRELAEINENAILLTPLRVKHDNQWIQPARNAFFIYSNSEEGLFEKDRKLRLFLNS